MSSPAELVGRKLGHYLIKEQIGAGGMGVVFLAHDERLERDVAIKVLPANTFSDQAVRKRFRKEALTLSKLNHPNIATIFDFDEENETCFLVTEYISGPSVDTMVVSRALPESQIISLGLQLADALIAAHDKGVVHCDLKPENLRLTPDGRLKVLDFGIARLMHKAADENEATMTMTLTQTNEIRGTLPYMAPEQLLGEVPDGRTDIWATGAVLYQLCAGSRPFQGKVATALAAEIIHTPPPQLSGLRKGVSPLLEGTIMKCLEKKAEHRYQTARELKVDLDRVLTRQGTVPVLPTKPPDLIPVESGHKLPWKLVSACFLLGVLLVGGWYWRQQHSRPPAKSSQRQSVAVLGFANTTANKQDDWISSILTTQLPVELAAGGKIRIISDEDVGRAKQDLSLNVSGSLASDTLARVNRRLNADLIVVGSYSNLDGNLLVNLYVQDTRTGETKANPTQRGRVKDIEQLITSTGIELRQKLNIDQVDAATAELMRASMPSNTQAAQNYVEGVAKLRMSDALGARDLLQKAIASDPNYAMAHSALSAAWDQLGYDSKKQEEAKKAFDLSGKLLREQKLLVEARYREATSDWDKASDVYRNLQSIAPDELDYGLRLASIQIRGGKAQDGQSTIQKLRAFSSPQRDDPRIDIVEAEAWRALSNAAGVKSSTQAAIQKAQAIGAKLLVAQAEWMQCSALRYLDELDAAHAASEKAFQTYKDTGDALGQARSLTCAANVLSSKGNTDEALHLHEQALALANSIGAKRDAAGATINIANILSDRGDSNAAIQRYRQAIAITKEIGDPLQAIMAENNLGVVYLNQGKLDLAIQALDESRKIAKDAGELVGLVEARINLSTLYLRQGDFTEATDGIRDAIAVAKQLGMQHYNAEALQILGDILLAQDDLNGAERAYSESLDIQTHVGDKYGTASSRLSLAGFELERDQPAKAETFASQSTQEFADEKNADLEASARTVWATALLDQNKTTEAADQIAKTEKLQLSDSSVKLDFAIARARVLAHTKPSAALSGLSAVTKEAEKVGLEAKLELRLAVGEIQLTNGNAAEAKIGLRRVQKDASDKGFKLIARKAATTLSTGR